MYDKVVIRKNPENFNEQDSVLFLNDIKLETSVVNIVILKNTSINEDMLVFNRFKILNESFKYREHFKPNYINSLKFLIKNNLKSSIKIEKGIWITDAWSNGYFHWFGDVLQKLFLIKKEFNIAKHQLILPYYYSKINYIVETLKIFEISVFYIKQGEQLNCKELITIKNFLVSGNYYESTIQEMNKIFRSRIENPLNNNINEFVYISRSKALRRLVTNEDNVIALFRKYNFSILYMEDYTWSQQVSLLKNTRILASIHGAGLTNMLFLKSDSSIIELRHPKSFIQNCFFSLSSALKHRYFYLIGQSIDEDAHTANISVNIEKLEELIKLTIQEQKTLSNDIDNKSR